MPTPTSDAEWTDAEWPATWRVNSEDPSDSALPNISYAELHAWLDDGASTTGTGPLVAIVEETEVVVPPAGRCYVQTPACETLNLVETTAGNTAAGAGSSGVSAGPLASAAVTGQAVGKNKVASGEIRSAGEVTTARNIQCEKRRLAVWHCGRKRQKQHWCQSGGNQDHKVHYVEGKAQISFQQCTAPHNGKKEAAASRMHSDSASDSASAASLSDTDGVMYQRGTTGVPEAAWWFCHSLTANRGDADGQCNLGEMYANGTGVPQDHSEAVRWYHLAANQGHARGQFNLGLLYQNGTGIAQDFKEAARLYRLAADQGHAHGQYNLGFMFQHGIGVLHDFIEAARRYRLAADQGLAHAQCNLGVMYHNGTGVLQDFIEAARWFRLAADQGHADAQCNIGHMFFFGNGLLKDHTEAARWYRLAADQEHTGGQYNLGFMVGLLYKPGTGVPKDIPGVARLLTLAGLAYDQGSPNLSGLKTGSDSHQFTAAPGSVRI